MPDKWEKELAIAVQAVREAAEQAKSVALGAAEKTEQEIKAVRKLAEQAKSASADAVEKAEQTRAIELQAKERTEQEIKAVRQLADSMAFGPDDSIFHGSGLEYAQSRVYLPGDSVKLIDWKMSARTDKIYVKEYQEPRQIPLYLLLLH